MFRTIRYSLPHRAFVAVVAGALLSLLVALTFIGTAGAETTTVVDEIGYGERHLQTSIVLASSGNPVVAWTDDDGVQLAICADPACGDAQYTTIGGDPTSTFSLALLSDDSPVVAFVDVNPPVDNFNQENQLLLVICDDAACTSRTTTDVEILFRGPLDLWPSVAITADDRPFVSYQTYSQMALVACEARACESPVVDLFEESASGAPTLQLDTYGNPVLSFRSYGLPDPNETAIALVVCYDEAECNTRASALVADSPTSFLDEVDRLPPAMALSSADHPVLVHVTSELTATICDDATCTAASDTVIDDVVDDFHSAPAVTLNDDGYPVIAYQDVVNRNLRLAVCADAGCTSVTTRVLDTDGSVGWGSSIVLNAAGNPIISHLDLSTGTVKVLACDDPQCASEAVAAGADAYECPAGFSLDVSGAEALCVQTLAPITDGGIFYDCPTTHRQEGEGADTTCTRTIYAALSAEPVFGCEPGLASSGGDRSDKTCTDSFDLYSARRYAATCPPGWVTEYDYTSSPVPDQCELRDDGTVYERFALTTPAESPLVCPGGFATIGGGLDTICSRTFAASQQPAAPSCPTYYNQTGTGPATTCAPPAFEWDECVFGELEVTSAGGQCVVGDGDFFPADRVYDGISVCERCVDLIVFDSFERGIEAPTAETSPAPVVAATTVASATAAPTAVASSSQSTPVQVAVTSPPPAPAVTQTAAAAGASAPTVATARTFGFDAATSTAAAASPTGAPLAHTGADHQPIMYLALGLIALGSMSMALRRRPASSGGGDQVGRVH